MGVGPVDGVFCRGSKTVSLYGQAHDDAISTLRCGGDRPRILQQRFQHHSNNNTDTNPSNSNSTSSKVRAAGSPGGSHGMMNGSGPSPLLWGGLGLTDEDCERESIANDLRRAEGRRTIVLGADVRVSSRWFRHVTDSVMSSNNAAKDHPTQVVLHALRASHGEGAIVTGIRSLLTTTTLDHEVSDVPQNANQTKQSRGLTPGLPQFQSPKSFKGKAGLAHWVQEEELKKQRHRNNEDDSGARGRRQELGSPHRITATSSINVTNCVYSMEEDSKEVVLSCMQLAIPSSGQLATATKSGTTSRRTETISSALPVTLPLTFAATTEFNSTGSVSALRGVARGTSECGVMDSVYISEGNTEQRASPKLRRGCEEEEDHGAFFTADDVTRAQKGRLQGSVENARSTTLTLTTTSIAEEASPYSTDLTSTLFVFRWFVDPRTEGAYQSFSTHSATKADVLWTASSSFLSLTCLFATLTESALWGQNMDCVALITVGWTCCVLLLAVATLLSPPRVTSHLTSHMAVGGYPEFCRQWLQSTKAKSSATKNNEDTFRQSCWRVLDSPISFLEQTSLRTVIYFLLWSGSLVSYAAITFVVPRDGDIIGNSQLVWLIVLLNWSLIRPMWVRPFVSFAIDAVLCIAYFIRTFSRVDTFPIVRSTALYMEAALLLYSGIVRLVLDASTRTAFATELEAQQLKDILERDQKKLEGLVKMVATNGVASRFIEHSRRQRQDDHHRHLSPNLRSVMNASPPTAADGAAGRRTGGGLHKIRREVINIWQPSLASTAVTENPLQGPSQRFPPTSALKAASSPRVITAFSGAAAPPRVAVSSLFEMVTQRFGARGILFPRTSPQEEAHLMRSSGDIVEDISTEDRQPQAPPEAQECDTHEDVAHALKSTVWSTSVWEMPIAIIRLDERLATTFLTATTTNESRKKGGAAVNSRPSAFAEALSEEENEKQVSDDGLKSPLALRKQRQASSEAQQKQEEAAEVENLISLAHRIVSEIAACWPHPPYMRVELYKASRVELRVCVASIPGPRGTSSDRIDGDEERCFELLKFAGVIDRALHDALPTLDSVIAFLSKIPPHQRSTSLATSFAVPARKQLDDEGSPLSARIPTTTNSNSSGMSASNDCPFPMSKAPSYRIMLHAGPLIGAVLGRGSVSYDYYGHAATEACAALDAACALGSAVPSVIASAKFVHLCRLVSLCGQSSWKNQIEFLKKVHHRYVAAVESELALPRSSVAAAGDAAIVCVSSSNDVAVQSSNVSAVSTDERPLTEVADGSSATLPTIRDPSPRAPPPSLPSSQHHGPLGGVAGSQIRRYLPCPRRVGVIPSTEGFDALSIAPRRGGYGGAPLRLSPLQHLRSMVRVGQHHLIDELEELLADARNIATPEALSSNTTPVGSHKPNWAEVAARENVCHMIAKSIDSVSAVFSESTLRWWIGGQDAPVDIRCVRFV